MYSVEFQNVIENLKDWFSGSLSYQSELISTYPFYNSGRNRGTEKVDRDHFNSEDMKSFAKVLQKDVERDIKRSFVL